MIKYLGNKEDLPNNYKLVRERVISCVFCMSFKATPSFKGRENPL